MSSSEISGARSAVTDWLTVGVMAMAVRSLDVTYHEGVHALACLGVGDKLKEYSALHVDCSTLAGTWQDKFISGSASLANILLGFILLFFLRRTPASQPTLRFFLWLFMLTNLLSGAGYWMVSGVANFGDWANVILGWQPHVAWRIGMALFGTLVFFGFIVLGLREWARIAGGAMPEVVQRSRRLAWLSYAVLPIPIIFAGLVFPYGFANEAVFGGLAASLGAMSPLLWMMELMQTKLVTLTPGPVLILQRHWGVIAAAAVTVAAYIGILGRVLTF